MKANKKAGISKCIQNTGKRIIKLSKCTFDFIKKAAHLRQPIYTYHSQ